jgi:hypothetical protein
MLLKSLFLLLTGRTYMHVLFSLWHLQFWSLLQIRPSNQNCYVCPCHVGTARHKLGHVPKRSEVWLQWLRRVRQDYHRWHSVKWNTNYQRGILSHPRCYVHTAIHSQIRVIIQKKKFRSWWCTGLALPPHLSAWSNQVLADPIKILWTVHLVLTVNLAWLACVIVLMIIAKDFCCAYVEIHV